MSEAWQDDGFTADELAFDDELGERLRASLDVVGPSEEAEERMLANLLAAQRAHDAEPATGAVAVEPIELPEVSVIEGGRRRREATRRRRLALAAAAALAATLVGAGVLSAMRASLDKGSTLAAYDAGAADVDEFEAAEVSDDSLSGSAAAETSVLDAAPEEKYVADEEASGGAAATDELVAMGGAFDVTGDPSYELAITYPEVRLSTGEALRVEEHDGAPVIIEERWVEQLVGEAEAFTDDGSDSVGCWVYRLPVSDDGLYVVRYLEGGSCFAIRVVE